MARAGAQAAPRRIVRDGAAPRRRARASRWRSDTGKRAPLLGASSPARSAATRSRSSSRASSRSTTRWAPARAATAWARSRSSIPKRVVAFPHLSLAGGAIRGWDRRNQFYFAMLHVARAALRLRRRAARSSRCPQRSQDVVLHGSGEEKIAFRYPGEKGRSAVKEHAFEGILPNLERRYRETDSVAVQEELAKYLNTRSCPECDGTRLRVEARHVRVAGRNIHELSVDAAAPGAAVLREAGAAGLQAGDRREDRARDRQPRAVPEQRRASTTCRSTRSADTLSGGEAQRIRLASQIGSGLTGVMYVLDEPSIGLHQRDNARLIETLKRLRDLGNSVIVVEHDEEAIAAADHVVDMGPGAGVHGGEIVAQGTPQEILRHPDSLTGQYLSGAQGDPDARARRRRDAQAQAAHRGRARQQPEERDASSFRSGLFVAVTGVSGSGKSTLINDTLYTRGRAPPLRLGGRARARTTSIERPRALRQGDQRRPEPDRAHAALQPGDLHGPLHADPRALRRRAGSARARLRRRALLVQREGRALRGVPGRRRASRSRCTSCPTSTCRATSATASATTARRSRCATGAERSHEVLRHDGRSRRTSSSAPCPRSRASSQTLLDVGLGYIQLGQSATTLSGGEAQRVKLSLELSKRDTGRTLYILDEPTTGLHFHDIDLLLDGAAPPARPRQHRGRDRAQPRRDQDRRLGDRPRARRRRRRRARDRARARRRT